jgi:hypothetical protein
MNTARTDNADPSFDVIRNFLVDVDAGCKSAFKPLALYSRLMKALSDPAKVIDQKMIFAQFVADNHQAIINRNEKQFVQSVIKMNERMFFDIRKVMERLTDDNKVICWNHLYVIGCFLTPDIFRQAAGPTSSLKIDQRVQEEVKKSYNVKLIQDLGGDIANVLKELLLEATTANNANNAGDAPPALPLERFVLLLQNGQLIEKFKVVRKMVIMSEVKLSDVWLMIEDRLSGLGYTGEKIEHLLKENLEKYAPFITQIAKIDPATITELLSNNELISGVTSQLGNLGDGSALGSQFAALSQHFEAMNQQK